ncbi:1-acyl-sn-glycerol-3-phosphate acyltransferase [Clostridium botulinum]|uniref:1-acyl-sn-glycerol-3-phosphate acyltransferase n=1 Tax=Clostridium botulinum TaxID=1491 RepID=A0A846JDR2_CLOBO|nr:lysophospholipid acyltransferase family protein [Clostridium botulinum]ACA56980.1 glycerol-3-phosphate O-acyltransferase [Clostridium botulinum A3 str. Loch Maree]NFH64530.1 1-acyl-sn-glycerol-3-phosphate acyltransferase [Clostridium botulinum]NFJ08264.1 1-acyl-sn-glycerol-3-phosphate acyltransferase [Clostridium botulinum]NFK16030.1 1-acyl-sn-glycerol-3-phosphate acyltransferase [Clostridium botulinum]NFM94585.1 1-acyl-sn-glycerol-3-phosphate acyltransferase [Clostridium botulinum]
MISPTMTKIIGYMPKGFLKFLSRKILNRYINKYANLKINGKENLKNIDKPIIFISNHLSNSDALVINKVLEDQDITFIAGVKLKDNSLTKLGLEITKTIPIKPNTADKEAIYNIVKTLKSGNNILIFPEGTRSRTAKLMEPKKGVVLIQKLSKATIVPLGISGTEKLLPINEKDMALECFQSADVTINIGKALELPKKNKEESKHEYEDRLMDYFMSEIAKLIPKEYRGIYNN